MKLFLFLMVEGKQQVCVILLTSHTGTDLGSVEAVILLCSVIRQGADTAFHKSPTRSFVLCKCRIEGGQPKNNFRRGEIFMYKKDPMEPIFCSGQLEPT